MLFSKLKGRKLVSTSTAETVGKVSGFLLDPQTRALVALEFKKTETGSVTRWADLAAVGADAVTVADAAAVVDPDDTLRPFTDKDHAVLKKRVLTTAGVDLGKVKDVDFDPASGAVRELVLSKETVAGARLVGVGSYAVVVETA